MNQALCANCRGIVDMTKLLFLFVALFTLAAEVFAQEPKQTVNWDQYRFLVGDWIGQGTGKPGEGTGGFSFTLELQGQVLVRRNHADYPAAKDKPAFSHEDLMVIYREPSDSGMRAFYFDSEGHSINYHIDTFQDPTKIVFVSDPSPSAPRFRFTYTLLKGGQLDIEFEIAPPGKPDAFSRYIKATATRAKN
jgi:hypothetical protein